MEKTMVPCFISPIQIKILYYRTTNLPVGCLIITVIRTVGFIHFASNQKYACSWDSIRQTLKMICGLSVIYRFNLSRHQTIKWISILNSNVFLNMSSLLLFLVTKYHLFFMWMLFLNLNLLTWQLDHFDNK